MPFPIIAAAMASLAAVNGVKALNHGDVMGAGIAAVQACTGFASVASAASATTTAAGTAGAAGTQVQGAVVTTESVVPNLGEVVDLTTQEGVQTVEAAAATAASTGEAVMVNLGHAMTGGSMILAIGGEKQLSKIMGGAAAVSQSLLTATESNVVSDSLDKANLTRDAEVVADTKLATGAATTTTSSNSSSSVAAAAAGGQQRAAAAAAAPARQVQQSQPKYAAPNRGIASDSELSTLQEHKAEINADAVREILTPAETTIHSALQRAADNANRAIAAHANPFTAMNSALMPGARNILLSRVSDSVLKSECASSLESMCLVDAAPEAFVLQSFDATGAEHLYFVDASSSTDVQQDSTTHTDTTAADLAENEEDAASAPTTTQKVMSMALDMIPGVGTGKGVTELILGRDVITGEIVPRWVSVVGLIPLGKVVAKLGKGVGSAVKATKSIGKVSTKVGESLASTALKNGEKVVAKEAGSVASTVLKTGEKTVAKESGSVASAALKNGEKAVAKEGADAVVSSGVKAAEGASVGAEKAASKAEVHEALKNMRSADVAKGQRHAPESLVEKYTQESALGNPESREIMKGSIKDSRILDAAGKKMEYSVVKCERVGNELKDVKYTIHYVEAGGKYYDVKTVTRQVLSDAAKQAPKK